MESSKHCTGEQYFYTAISFVVIHWSLSNLDLEIEKTHPRIHACAEEKENMTIVWSKVTSEYENLANGGILTVKYYRICI